ncbi:MAG TPA: helix-turn-helix domain-containing protein [Anaerolineales bacterium]|nr:helix-turn-helix domain-containing protein [Anaerolineales bacterium]
MMHGERLACASKPASGQTDAEIAKTLGWSKWTVRKWRRAYQKNGEDGLLSRMGRPRGGPLSTFSPQMQDVLEKMRKTHPGWGPVTLVEELAGDSRFLGLRLPGRAQVAAFLKAKDLARSYQRRAGLPPANAPKAKQVHEEWEMDAQGAQPVEPLGQVSVVNLIDVVSRLKIGSYPHLGARSLDGRDYQLVLRVAFLDYGLPLRISLDHDSAFFDNTSVAPYPSRLHLWLTALDVQVVFIQKAPPLEHARIERNHQTMSAQTIIGQTWTDLTALWQGLSQRREFLNTRYPSRSLHYQAPLEAYPQAVHSGRPYRPEWEEQMLDLQRVYTLLAQGRWFRETSCHGEFWLGLQRYNAGRKCAKSTVEITFDPAHVQFIAHKLGTDEIRRFESKGLTKTDLMGELTLLTRLPVYQLALPFSRQAWREMELSRFLGGTTF